MVNGPGLLRKICLSMPPNAVWAGKALIDALIAEGKREGWSKLYWVTRENNPARKLYDKYGKADDYVRYRLSL